MDRTKILIGENNINKLANASILVVGVGGVGGYCVEMLARAGVGHLTIVDFDVISKTNLNRQIIALENNIGSYKVDEFKKRILEINKDCIVTALKEKIDVNNIAQIVNNNYDYVIDAIDIIEDKVHLIKYCEENGIKSISAMGAGNRFGIPNFKVCDIYQTYNDGLAKIVRKKLRELGISNHLVVSTTDCAQKNGFKEIGSISYYPAMCGCVIAGYVINELIKE